MAVRIELDSHSAVTPAGLSKALRKLKRTMDREGFNKEIRSHECHETPSQKRRKKRHTAIRRIRREARNAKDNDLE